MLPQFMDTSSISSPYFHCYQAAQVKLADKGFLSRDITVADLLLNRADIHHVYPKQFLKEQGHSKGTYNQTSNYVVAQSEINIAVGGKAPNIYFKEILDQCITGIKKYGGITDKEELIANLKMNCIPVEMLDEAIPTYEEFLVERRKMMAHKIKKWFEII